MALDPVETEQAQQQLTENMATYEELAQLEQEFEDIDCEVSKYTTFAMRARFVY